MNSKHAKTLSSIFQNPILANVQWEAVENMLQALGAIIKEHAGSRVCIKLNGVVSVFHRPHPQKEIDKGALKSLRQFLTKAGIKP